MTNTIPTSAVVRPRVAEQRSGSARLLEEVVLEMVDANPMGVAWIIGGPGSGKSTAVAHLTRIFAGDERFEFLDEPTQAEADRRGDGCLVFATARSPAGRRGVALRLPPWQIDDLIEYLLSAYHEQCTDIMARLSSAAHKNWIPELARVVIERFVEDPTLTDPTAALLAEVGAHLPKQHHLTAAADCCLAILTENLAAIRVAQAVLDRIRCSSKVVQLLRHRDVQLPLAAGRLVDVLSTSKSLRPLGWRLPPELIELVAHHCRENEIALQRLRGALVPHADRSVCAKAASILCLADPTWVPNGDPEHPLHLAGGFFRRVHWSNVNLERADLSKADFTAADLHGANLAEADATGAVFCDANLDGARLIGLQAGRAEMDRATLVDSTLSLAQFARASLAGANLSKAKIVKADLSSADLTQANLSKADLFGANLEGATLLQTNLMEAKLDDVRLAQADLRTAVLHGASFVGAQLAHVQMEDVEVRDARFAGAELAHAHLTGAMLPKVDLREANLAFSQLAEVDWPNADLRGANLSGASFHMGSSRSGLVGSPIASEGSRTGFYTDDREELYFKRPEEIRKANLRGADLRGAKIGTVDFYLVDLRDARYDENQAAQFRRTGAILDDWEND